MILITESQRTEHKIQDLLLKHGIRPTSQRIDIAGVLLSRPQHLCADQVLAKVNHNANLVSKATVYNTLNLFAEKGLIREVIIESGKVFYDSNTDTHHHIYNEDTGVLQDIAASGISIHNMPELPEGTVKSGVDIIIRVKNKTL